MKEEAKEEAPPVKRRFLTVWKDATPVQEGFAVAIDDTTPWERLDSRLVRQAMTTLGIKLTSVNWKLVDWQLVRQSLAKLNITLVFTNKQPLLYTDVEL